MILLHLREYFTILHDLNCTKETKFFMQLDSICSINCKFMNGYFYMNWAPLVRTCYLLCWSVNFWEITSGQNIVTWILTTFENLYFDLHDNALVFHSRSLQTKVEVFLFLWVALTFSLLHKLPLLCWAGFAKLRFGVSYFFILTPRLCNPELMLSELF